MTGKEDDEKKEGEERGKQEEALLLDNSWQLASCSWPGCAPAPKHTQLPRTSVSDEDLLGW